MYRERDSERGTKDIKRERERGWVSVCRCIRGGYE